MLGLVPYEAIVIGDVVGEGFVVDDDDGTEVVLDV